MAPGSRAKLDGAARRQAARTVDVVLSQLDDGIAADDAGTGRARPPTATPIRSAWSAQTSDADDAGNWA